MVNIKYRNAARNWVKGRKQHSKKGIALCAILVLLTGCGGTAGGQANADKDVPAQTVEDNGQEDDQTAQEESTKFPAFTAVDLEGNTVTEGIFAQKDLTVLNIWGTFCNPCVGEMPELGEWAKEMPDNVQMVGLIIDINGEEDTEHRDLAVDITSNAGADFTQIIANQDFAPVLKDVLGVPTTMFIDKDGNIVGDSILGADVDGYKKFVEDYFSGQ